MKEIHIIEKGEGFSIIFVVTTKEIRQQISFKMEFSEALVVAAVIAKNRHVLEHNIFYKGNRVQVHF